MLAKTLMVQGTASSVGKSIIVAALCRILHQDGYQVAPFKAQNMALNSFVTREGGEIGRAQAVQAEAAGIEPSIHMNPVLLKPEGDARSQVIVLGKVADKLDAVSYYRNTPKLLKTIEDSLNLLRSTYDVVLIEGAGSPTEINLKEKEIVNMRIAKLASTPVILVGDIDRGGVFASIVGTMHLLDMDERDLVKGFLINKFRGDITLLKPGLDMLEQRVGKPVLGVIPYFRDITIAQEDSVYLDERHNNQNNGNLNIVIVRLPHISNYDDFDPLETMGCSVRYVTDTDHIAQPDLVILPGTKSTIADLCHIKQKGLAERIINLAQSGTPIIGICGGYQMLGKNIRDPDRVESEQENIPGLGLLNIETIFLNKKATTQVKAQVESNTGLLQDMKGIEVTGYEIHMGRTIDYDGISPFKVIDVPQGESGYTDGAMNSTGLIFGSYIHGLFHNHTFTLGLLNRLRALKALPPINENGLDRQQQYDKLADIARHSIDMPGIYDIIFKEAR